MPHYNKVLFMGHLTRDVELRYTPKGTAVGKFGMATNRKWKTESGEQREEVVFVDFDAFGKSAETLSKYVKKGSALFVEGRLKLDEWEDKTTHAKRQKLSVVVESFQFVSTGERTQAARPEPSATAPANGEMNPPGEKDDDVPF